MLSSFSLLKVAESATSQKELFIRFTVHDHCILMSFIIQVISHLGFDGRVSVLIVTVPGHLLPVTVYTKNNMTIVFLCTPNYILNKSFLLKGRSALDY